MTMYIILVIAIVLVWWGIGIASFIYWWTKDFDFTTFETWVCLAAGCFGPFTFLIGRSIHGDKKELPEGKFILKRQKTILKKRQ